MSQNTQAQINTLDIHRMLTLYYQPQLDLQMLETCTIFTTKSLVWQRYIVNAAKLL